jgi:hypothetical protein
MASFKRKTSGLVRGVFCKEFLEVNRMTQLPFSRAAQLRETFVIPNKPKNLEETRADWERDVPVWIKLD